MKPSPMPLHFAPGAYLVEREPGAGRTVCGRVARLGRYACNPETFATEPPGDRCPPCAAAADLGAAPLDGL